MIWTTAVPTEPGFYWLRGLESVEVVQVTAFRDGSGFIVSYAGSDEQGSFGTGLSLDGDWSGHEWFGPIQPPVSGDPE